MADQGQKGAATVASLLQPLLAGGAWPRVAGQGAAVTTAALPFTWPATLLTRLCFHSSAAAAGAAHIACQDRTTSNLLGSRLLQG